MHRIEHLGKVRGKEHRIYFESESCSLDMTSSAKLILELLPAMRDARPIQVDSLDEEMQRQLPHIMEVISSWSGRVEPVAVSANDIGLGRGRGRGTASFFSGGLDSFYTLLKHRSEITDIIFVHGLDIDLDDIDLHSTVIANLQQIAREMGVNLLEIKTNMRELWDKTLSWEFSHGAALAAIGHMLSQHFSKIYIPASFHTKNVFPYGSHPLLDPLWGDSSLQFVHDGIEATRVDKAEFVAGSDVAMTHLRVCYENREGAYNCSVCRKCVQTMLCFMAVNALSRCHTFHGLPPVRAISRIDFSSMAARVFAEDVVRRVEARNGNDALVRVLKRAYARAIWLSAWRDLRDTLRRAVKLYWKARPAWLFGSSAP